MKSHTRQASARWLGTPRRGKGAINTPSTSLNMALHGAQNSKNRRGTNPPELVAAAIAGSFSLTLASELRKAGYKPRQIDTTAMVILEHLAARWTLTQINLDVTATVSGMPECDFVDATLQAKTNCPISRALGANVVMSAKLTRNE